MNYAPAGNALGGRLDRRVPVRFDLLPLCGALVVSVSGYRARKRGDHHPDRKRIFDSWRLALIQAIHAIAALVNYIEPFYNRRRRHSTLSGDLPERFLEKWISAQHAQ